MDRPGGPGTGPGGWGGGWRGGRWARGRGADRIEIRDLQVLGVHGVLPEERERAQPFSLDVDAWLDTAAAGATDELAATVDYGELVEVAAGVVAGRRYQLVEALADAVAAALLERDRRLAAVMVTVRKLRPPLPYHVGSVGVRVVRRRDGSGHAGPGHREGEHGAAAAAPSGPAGQAPGDPGAGW